MSFNSNNDNHVHSHYGGSREVRPNTELRYLSAQHRHQLSQILDVNHAWKALASIIKKPDPGMEHEPLFTTPSINLLEHQLSYGKSPTEAMLLYWSTYGRQRPTIKILLEYLVQADIKRAVDIVCNTILNVSSADEILFAQTTTTQQSTDLASSMISDCSSFDIIDNEDVLNSSFSSLDDSNNKCRKVSFDQLNGNVSTGQCNSRSPAGRLYDIESLYLFQNLDDCLNKIKCDRYSFDAIYSSTNGFCHKPYHLTQSTGTKLGEGRFSSVYKAQTSIENNLATNPNEMAIVAAKLLKSDCDKRFLVDEINLVRRINHDNILKFLGISVGRHSVHDASPTYICLIYDFMPNGSLLDRLACRYQTEPLTWQQRMSISIGIARGVSYLHKFSETPIIHRDIKSANVFLDANLKPKVGDFTLVRQLERARKQFTSNNQSMLVSCNELLHDDSEINHDINKGNWSSTQQMATTQMMTQMTQNIMGTSIYMPVEAFRGDISVKFDTFSFGVVLLELITGMKPFDDIKQIDILSYVNEEIAELDDQIAAATSNDDGGLSADLLISNLSISDTHYWQTTDQQQSGQCHSRDTANLRECQERAKDEFLRKILDTKAGQWDFSTARSMFRIALLATEARKKTRPTMSQVLPMLETLETMLE